MLADEPTLRPGLYRLPEDPVGQRVLIPGFSSSTSVQGAFGWFSAGWIGKLAPGLAHYLNRDDTGPIEFTVAPCHYPAEIEAMERGRAMTADEAQNRVADVFTDGRVHAQGLAAHALDCMAWMIASERLNLRVAVPTADSNYHPKIWLFRDDSEQVVARGSGNATGRGIESGVEHIDVDVSWKPDSRERVAQGIRMLEDWRRGRSQGIDRVVALDEALRAKIIETAPEAPPGPREYETATVASGNPRWAVDRWRQRSGARRPATPRLSIPPELEWRAGRYSHQGAAVEAWEGPPQPERGTIAMATGAGKTLTALICAARCQDRLPAGSPFAVVVSAPSVPLILQWKEEIAKFGVSACTPTLASNSETALTNWFRGLRAGGTAVLVITNNLLCTDSFRKTMERKCRGLPTLFIADEAHRLGAAGFVDATPDFFERRLALSATPERQYDPDGTEKIFEFFGPPVFEFGLDRAIGFCLVPYDYLVHAAVIVDDELDEFMQLTRRIGPAMAAADEPEADEMLLRLLLKRRRIIENAEAKLPLLRAVLERRNPSSLRHALIYASSKNPAQFDAIAAMLRELGCRWAPVTQETTRHRANLESTLRAFRDGGYQILLAKKVLDEGVDIPSIREAFIVASSTVEREWVQRRGRVLRRHPGKRHAVVHDFVALPPAELARNDESLKKIVANELARSYAFAGHARNAAGPRGALADIERLRGAYWPDTVKGEPPRLRAGDQVVAQGLGSEETW